MRSLVRVTTTHTAMCNNAFRLYLISVACNHALHEPCSEWYDSGAASELVPCLFGSASYGRNVPQLLYLLYKFSEPPTLYLHSFSDVGSPPFFPVFYIPILVAFLSFSCCITASLEIEIRTIRLQSVGALLVACLIVPIFTILFGIVHQAR